LAFVFRQKFTKATDLLTGQFSETDDTSDRTHSRRTLSNPTQWHYEHGVSTGPHDYRYESTRCLLKDMEIPLLCLTHLISFKIIRQSLNSRAGYLAGVTKASKNRALFRDFDSHIDHALEVILEHPLAFSSLRPIVPQPNVGIADTVVTEVRQPAHMQIQAKGVVSNE
jgi:hypothetical protein